MIFNNELHITLPDSFREMDPAEYSNLLVNKNGEGAAFKDEEAHIVVSLGFKKAGVLAGLAMKMADPVSVMEKSLKRAMASCNYRTTGMVEADFGGTPAKGIRYTYSAKDGSGVMIDMVAESYVIRRPGSLYYLHYYTRAALEEENRGVKDAIVRSAEW